MGTALKARVGGCIAGTESKPRGSAPQPADLQNLDSLNVAEQPRGAGG